MSMTDESFEVTVFPNPFQESFQVHVPSANQEPISVRVSDTNGKVVFQSSEWTTNKVNEVRSNFAQGTYFLFVQKGKEQKIVKLVKVD